MTPCPAPGHSRRSLLRTAAFVVGSSLIGASAVRAQSEWTGSTSSDWNDSSNWTAGLPGDHAIINDISSNVPVISADIGATPIDIAIGTGGNVGRLDHTAGDAWTAANNWMFVGNTGGNGSYNLADTTASGGATTGYGTGSGSMFVGGSGFSGGRLYIGGNQLAGSAGTGVVNVNTTGVLAINNDLVVGINGGTGTLNLDNGAVSSGSSTSGASTFIGTGAGSSGSMNMSGGSYDMFGRLLLGEAGGTGILNLSGGTFTKHSSEEFRIGDGGDGTVVQTGGTVDTTTGELWVGQGGGTAEYSISSGNLNVGSGLVVGRDSATGTFNQTGGTVTKTGGGSITFGTINNGTGIGNISGGLMDIQSGLLYVGEGGSGSGTVNLSGTGEIRTSEVSVGDHDTVTGQFNLNGGTLQTGSLHGGTATSNVSFNGTQIVATGDNAAFITGLTSADVAAGGLLVDSNGFTVGSDQALSGVGGVDKSGAGTLTLAGVNTYTGDTLVSAGTLFVTGQLGDTDSNVAGGASLTIADGAVYNMVVGALGDQTSVTGTGTVALDGVLNFDLSGAAIANGNSWQVIDNASLIVSYSVTFAVAGFSEAANVWTLVDGDNTWAFDEATGELLLTVAPEPGIALLGGLGLIALLRRRRS